MLVIPGIDLIDGRVVRLTHGDYDRKTDYGLDPLDVAHRFADAGAPWIHVVDLSGAKAGRPLQLEVFARLVAALPDVQFQIGGGIRNMESLEAALRAGAKRVVVGTALVKDPVFASEAFRRHGESVVAGIDTKEGKMATEGWREGGSIDGLELAQELVTRGCRRIVTTDIATDGAFTGPNIPWLKAMSQAVPVPVVASGGIASAADLDLLDREVPTVEGVIVGKALYEGRLSLAEAFLRERID